MIMMSAQKNIWAVIFNAGMIKYHLAYENNTSILLFCPKFKNISVKYPYLCAISIVKDIPYQGISATSAHH